MFDVCCLMPDVWCEMCDVCCLMSVVWCQTSNVCYLISDVWCQTITTSHRSSGYAHFWNTHLNRREVVMHLFSDVHQTSYVCVLMSDQTSDVYCCMSEVDVRCLMFVVWYQTSDVCCLISDVWCQSSFLWCSSDVLCFCSDVRRLMFIVAFRSRCLMSDVCFLISDVWCLLSDIRRLMFVVWCQ